jgi:hypothetical protein
LKKKIKHKLDKDPHSPKKLDPDPFNVDADPKHLSGSKAAGKYFTIKLSRNVIRFLIYYFPAILAGKLGNNLATVLKSHQTQRGTGFR